MKLKTQQKMVCLVMVVFLGVVISSLVLYISYQDRLVVSSISSIALKPLMDLRFYDSIDVISHRYPLRMDIVEQYLSVWKQVPSQVENTIDQHAQLLATPSVIPNGDEVMVVWRNIPAEHGLTKKRGLAWLVLSFTITSFATD